MSLSGDLRRENSIACPALAAELVRLKVDVIVTAWSDTNPRRQGSNCHDSHCHGAGYRSCWQWVCRQPGATWWKHHRIVHLAPEISGKRLELLKEIVPKLSRVAVLGTSTNPGNAQQLKETELAAGAFGVTASIPRCTRVPRILRPHSEPQAKGALTQSSCCRASVANSHRTQIAELAVKNRLPAIYHRSEFVEAGGL